MLVLFVRVGYAWVFVIVRVDADTFTHVLLALYKLSNAFTFVVHMQLGLCVFIAIDPQFCEFGLEKNIRLF